MRISVVIPTWRRPVSLRRCLAGLAVQDRAPDEVVVVVRREDEESKRMLQETTAAPQEVRLLDVPRAGVVAALNRGFAAAQGDVVAITDDDTVPRPDWLARIDRHFAADPTLGALGGRDWLHPASPEGDQATVGRVTWYGRMIGNQHLGFGAPRPVDVLKGANLSFRAVPARSTGLRIDARLKGVGIQVHWEIDVCLALKDAGWKLVYDPAVAVDHYPAERFEDDSRHGPVTGVTLEHEVHNETYLMLKWFPWWRRAGALGYWSVVGSRSAPGLVTLAERLLRESDRRAALHRFASAQRGRRQGVRTLRAQATSDE